MSAQTYYKQCTMTSPTAEGQMVRTAWIPEKFATQDRVVYFGKKTSKPDRLWKVVSVPESRISHEYLVEHERDYKTQRSASDI